MNDVSLKEFVAIFAAAILVAFALSGITKVSGGKI